VAGSPSTRATRLALAAICATVVAVGGWNALHYPPGNGYDAAAHMAYADGLVPGGHLPGRTPGGEFFNPPGYYAVAGSLDWLAARLGAAEPHRAGIGVNVLFLLGTVLLTWRIARELWPERERLALAAAAFVALVPVTVKAASMFHPETMSLFLSTLALWLCVRTLADPRYAPALGLALGAAQLVRAFALWTVAVVAVALLAARRRRQLAVVLALAAVIPLPWYVHETVEYGTPLAFNRSAPSTPLLERRPLRFYVDPGIPDVVANPFRPHFRNLALPTTYTELWGDYFGNWAWNGIATAPSSSVRHRLELQSVVGVLPTVLAVAGWVALLLASLRSPPRLVPALLPLLGLAGYVTFTVSYPSNDGDVLKATYMLGTTAGWAVGFGYAVDRLSGRLRRPVLALLGLCVLAELPFVVY
jgi:Dolichyl-phosphate-mannose-protein mannosyltransferase